LLWNDWLLCLWIIPPASSCLTNNNRKNHHNIRECTTIEDRSNAHKKMEDTTKPEAPQEGQVGSTGSPVHNSTAGDEKAQAGSPDTTGAPTVRQNLVDAITTRLSEAANNSVIPLSTEEEETNVTEPTPPTAGANNAENAKNEAAADLSELATVGVAESPPGPTSPLPPSKQANPAETTPPQPMEEDPNSTGDGGSDNEDEDDDTAGENSQDDNGRRPDNSEWQPPKKRRRKPEPMKPFNDMLYELLAFRAREGHCRVPLDTKSALGRWVANLRTQKSNLRKGYHSLDLTQERLAVLDSVDFVWDLQQFDSDSRWKRQFEELCAFKAEHGHCNVPQSTPLGKWVKMQRENYRETQLKASGQLPTGRSKPRPTLSQFRIEQLESIGFNWKVAAPAVGWEHRFQELLEYRRMHGDCNVPQAWQENRQLGRWVMKQRCQYTLRQKGDKNQLSDDRVVRLEEIGFSWTAPSFRKKKEGDRNFPLPPGTHVVPQPQPHLMPPGGPHHQALPPHDFRRWV